MIGRLLLRILRAQYGWARPLGDFNVRWLQALFRPIEPIADLLHGKWGALANLRGDLFTLAHELVHRYDVID